MANHETLSTPFIYLRSTGEKISVTKEQHDSFYKEADRIRHKEQDRGRCMCPYRFIWKCDGECLDCEYHAAGDMLSYLLPLRTAGSTARLPQDFVKPTKTKAAIMLRKAPMLTCFVSTS